MPTNQLDFRPAREEDLDRLADILAHAFGFPRDDAKPWFARTKLENVRVLERQDQERNDKRIVGGLLEIPMGQYFGGSSVSMMGVAGVGIAPEERGRGTAAHMMIAMLREARSLGYAISTLYPATVSLYRRAGYERAGARFEISLDPRRFEIGRLKSDADREMTINEVEGTPDNVMALYAATARRCSGYLDRGPYVWDRVSKPRGYTPKTFTVSHSGSGTGTGTGTGAQTQTPTLEGYVVVAHVTKDGLDTKAVVTDMAATTERAARAILRLLIEYRSIGVSVKWHGGVSDAFTNLLPERFVDIRLVDYFMVRILDVARAMTMRGWPRGTSGSMVLEVMDATMPENSGRYLVSIEGGRASVSPADPKGAASAHPYAKISERGLAALYTGYVQAHVAAQCGWLEADEDARALLDTWFGGPLPTMPDGF